ncbi:formyltetrahydrofolate deformylase [Actinomycetospora endophytica]|uniref:Formyltetrahydrofolate deformylase n=1 Tax=Actinomycetospora endophytica TaxID=2291215 RepID=A0ABS8P5S6_9PSEU|nr:formyltetrahydrofolate deformylase [Actinomycetospora endophytica]MCD2193378.1 formyltetrahydrofolate deformylase [Actinomycetospora endophytica]
MTGSPSADTVGRLLIRCADRQGIVAAVASFLSASGANILSLDQHATAHTGGTYFQRTEFALPSGNLQGLRAAFASDVARGFGMDFTLTDSGVPKRLGILVSRIDHCLLDLLWRTQRGELDVSIEVVVSNHADLAGAVEPFGVPFVHVPVTPETRAEAETRQAELLQGVDLVVLARYMQIVSGSMIEAVGAPMINIHHSFLPAFVGASPYRQAKERGVKVVGATAHYVTEVLDDGPIIEQDVVRVNHRHTTADLTRLGADVERSVLSRAVRWHCEDRVVRDGDTTIVF